MTSPCILPTSFSSSPDEYSFGQLVAVAKSGENDQPPFPALILVHLLIDHPPPHPIHFGALIDCTHICALID